MTVLFLRARKKLLSRGTGLIALTLPQCVITSKEDVDAKDCVWGQQKDEAQDERSRIIKREVWFSKDSNLAPHF